MDADVDGKLLQYRVLKETCPGLRELSQILPWLAHWAAFRQGSSAGRTMAQNLKNEQAFLRCSVQSLLQNTATSYPGVGGCIFGKCTVQFAKKEKSNMGTRARHARNTRFCILDLIRAGICWLYGSERPKTERTQTEKVNFQPPLACSPLATALVKCKSSGSTKVKQ